MGARAVLAELHGAGLAVELVNDKIMVGPTAMLTDSMRAAVRAHREELVLVLQGAVQPVGLWDELVAAINRCCDRRGDDGRHRAALIADCSVLTPQEQVGLLDYFKTEIERLRISNRTIREISP